MKLHTTNRIYSSLVEKHWVTVAQPSFQKKTPVIHNGRQKNKLSKSITNGGDGHCNRRSNWFTLFYVQSRS